MNALFVIEFAVALGALIYAVNLYSAEQIKTYALEESADEFIYYTFPKSGHEDMTAAGQKRSDKLARLSAYIDENPWIKGVSRHARTAAYFDRRKAEAVAAAFGDGNALDDGDPFDDGADIYLYDELTLKNIKYPLSDGQWLNGGFADGVVPCVVGGALSGNYRVGDILDMYTHPGVDGTGEIHDVRFVVTGVLKKPETMIKFTNAITNPLSLINAFAETDYISFVGLFIVAPITMVEWELDVAPTYADAELVYYDKNASSEQVEGLREFLGTDRIQSRELILQHERERFDEAFSLFAPFFTLLFLVSFSGLVTMCLLSTYKSMDTVKLYYLGGASKRTTLGMVCIYAFFFIFISLCVFGFITYLFWRADNINMPAALFTLYGYTIPPLLIASVPVCLGAFTLPLLFFSKLSIVDLIRR